MSGATHPHSAVDAHLSHVRAHVSRPHNKHGHLHHLHTNTMHSTATQKPATSVRTDNKPRMPSASKRSSRALPAGQTIPPPGDFTPKVWDERWDVYFHAFLLHETKHSDCYYYNGQWWFPENRRNEKTLHMFVAARWAPLDNLKYYNLHLVCPPQPCPPLIPLAQRQDHGKSHVVYTCKTQPLRRSQQSPRGMATRLCWL